MKIILNFPDMAEAAEEIVVEWLAEIIAKKDALNPSPLRYVNGIQVLKDKEEAVL
jgi:hypothetical protein